MFKKLFAIGVIALSLMSCGTSDKIIVYTNSGNNGRQEFLEKYAKENGFDIAVVSAGGTDISNRLLAEKDNPVADVIFGLNAIEYEKLKKENIIEKFVPTWAKDVPKGLSDPEGYYNAVTVTPLLAIYNPDKVPAVPKDWTDLATNPIFKDKFSFLGLNGGTSKIIYSSIVSRYRDDNGDLNISKEGWDMIKSLFDNMHLVRGEEDYYGNMRSGERPITMLWGSGAIERDKKFNFKSEFMKPEIGIPTAVEQLAILKGSKKKEQAKKFVEWLGSDKVQSVWAEKFGTIPALPKALEKAPKENQDMFKQVKVQQMDWKFISENIDSWVEKAQLQYVK